MKKYIPIMAICLGITGIFTLWLIPSSKGERKTKYVRVYSEEKNQQEEDTVKTRNPVTKKTEKKIIHRIKKKREIVKIDTLPQELSMKKIHPSMYSRSMHYKPVHVNKPPLPTMDTSINVTVVEEEMTPKQ